MESDYQAAEIVAEAVTVPSEQKAAATTAPAAVEPQAACEHDPEVAAHQPTAEPQYRYKKPRDRPAHAAFGTVVPPASCAKQTAGGAAGAAEPATTAACSTTPDTMTAATVQEHGAPSAEVVSQTGPAMPAEATEPILASPVNPTGSSAGACDTLGTADAMVSIFAGAKNTTVIEHRTFRAVVEAVKTRVFRSVIAQVREAYARGGKEAAKPLKVALLAFTIFGTFRDRRNDKNLMQRSHLIGVDIDAEDNPSLDANTTRTAIAADPYCVGVYVSMSFGVKAFFRADPARTHDENNLAGKAYVKEKYGLTADPDFNGSLSSLCFVGDDPEAYVASGPVAMLPHPAREVSAPSSPQRANSTPFTGHATEEWEVLHMREVFHALYPTRPARPDRTPWLEAISAVKNAGIPEANGIAFLKELFPEQEPGEYEEAWDTGFDQFTMGTMVQRAKATGWTPTASCQKIIAAQAAKASAERAAAEVAARKAEKQAALLAKANARKFGVGDAPVKPIPRFLLKGVGFSTAGNLSAVSAQAKSGKTAVIGGLLAAVAVAEQAETTTLTIGAASNTPDCLGLSAAAPLGRKVIHIDTEQSRYDHHQCVMRALKRAGLQACPPWLESYGMAGCEAHELVELVRLKLADAAVSGGTHSVVIDGVADLVNDVNEANETNPLVAELHGMAIQYDCPIILVIHENPTQTTGKSRGHLGSQLERKCESVLRLEKEKDGSTVIYIEKCRGKPVWKKDGPRIAWNEELSMHASLPTTLAEDAAGERQAEMHRLAQICIPQAGSTHGLTPAKLLKAIMKALECAEKTAETWKRQMKCGGYIVQDKRGGKFYRLA